MCDSLVLNVYLQILSCVKHVLWSDHEVKVRQAALVVLKHMIKSISIQVRTYLYSASYVRMYVRMYIRLSFLG